MIVEAPMNFGVVVAQLNDGAALAKASSELQRLIELTEEEAACRNEAVKSSFVFTLHLTMARKGHVEVSYTTKVNEPKKDGPETLFFITPGHNLSTKMTKQVELPLREAPRARTQEADSGKPDAKEV